MKKFTLIILTGLFIQCTVFAQITSTTTGGNWGDIGTWVGGVIPSAIDDVIIADGAVVTINVPAVAKSLVVGQGTSGVLEYEATIAQLLVITGDITITVGGSFQSASTGTQAGHILLSGGSLTNNGILDFSTNGNTAGAEIIFAGASNASFGGTGSVTDISRITLNKGTDATSILELNPSVFTFKGASVTPGATEGFLTIQNGMFKISGNFPMENGLFTGTVNYTVPVTGGIWFNNPNYTVAARTGTAYIEGTLIMDAGTYNVGTSVDNRLGYIDGSVITINGGAINVASRFSATTTFGLTYTQTGGTITVNTVGSTSSSYASFDIRDLDLSTFNMSGGSIIIQNPGAGGAGPRDYLNRPAISNITGGTLVIGNSSTAPAQTFYVQGVAPNIDISNAGGGQTARLFNNLRVVLNTTINPGSGLSLDDGTTGYQYTQQGASFINAGTLDGSFAGSRLFFEGTGTAQTYGGNGAIITPLAALQVNNPLGLTIGNTIASEIITGELVMAGGDISTGINTLVLGTGTGAVGTFNYTTGTIVGKFKRWVAASTGAVDFPVGISGVTRNANIDFTAAPATGGTLTTEWLPLPGGDNGLPLIDGIYLVTNTSSEGYWSIVSADGFSGGVYNGTFNANGLVTITDFSQLVLVKRSGNSFPWLLDGTHIPTTGSNAAAVLSRTGMSGFSEFGIGGSITSLPVTIEYFKGSRQSNGHLLDWKVDCTGSPTATLTLERSSNSRDFVSLNSTVATALRCLQPFNYTDASPLPGINYYRIKMTDADGRFTYSNILALLNNSKGFDITGLMPNPVVNRTVLSIASATASRMEIVVSDISGRRMMNQSVNLIAGSNMVPLNLGKLAAGTYQLTGYGSNGEVKTIRFIKE